MTNQQTHTIRDLIPDLLPPDHISFNTKRVRFINGEGVVLFNDIYAVEIYLPRNDQEEPEFFGVQKHHGRIQELTSYFRKPQVLPYNSPKATELMKSQFEEAVFQFEPLNELPYSNVLQGTFTPKIKANTEIYLREHLGGAA